MFSLRKRFKQIETEHDANLIKRSFDSLPIELYLFIFDYFSGRDLIKFRSINSFFKNLIDSTKYIWDKKLQIHVKLRRKLNIDHFLRFALSTANDSIVIDCLKEIKQTDLLKYSQCSDKKLKVNFKFLNTLSFCCLDIFANNCHQLKIESFFSSYGQFKSTHQTDASNKQLKKFTNLTHLDLACLLYDSKQHKYFIWNDIYLEEFIQDQFTALFLNITNLKLSYYCGSTKNLIRCLRNLINLETLELDNCNTVNDYSNRNSRKKLSISKLNLNSVTTSLAVAILQRLTDLNSIKCLHLVLNDKDNNLLNNLIDIISTLNLISFKTNFHFEIP